MSSALCRDCGADRTTGPRPIDADGALTLNCGTSEHVILVLGQDKKISFEGAIEGMASFIAFHSGFLAGAFHSSPWAGR